MALWTSPARGRDPPAHTAQPGPGLTWRWGLDLGLGLLGVGSREDVGRGILAALDLALEGVQALDVLLLQGAGSTARRAHVQVGGQLTPLLVLVDLHDQTGGSELPSPAVPPPRGEIDRSQLTQRMN